jgi:hypothetical protein
MDEARAVLQRLRRIERLEREAAPPRTLLAEVRELLRETEAWLEAERSGTDLAADALDRCHEAMRSSETPVGA